MQAMFSPSKFDKFTAHTRVSELEQRGKQREIADFGRRSRLEKQREEEEQMRQEHNEGEEGEGGVGRLSEAASSPGGRYSRPISKKNFFFPEEEKPTAPFEEFRDDIDLELYSRRGRKVHKFLFHFSIFFYYLF